MKKQTCEFSSFKRWAFVCLTFLSISLCLQMRMCTHIIMAFQYWQKSCWSKVDNICHGCMVKLSKCMVPGCQIPVRAMSITSAVCNSYINFTSGLSWYGAPSHFFATHTLYYPSKVCPYLAINLITYYSCFEPMLHSLALLQNLWSYIWELDHASMTDSDHVSTLDHGFRYLPVLEYIEVENPQYCWGQWYYDNHCHNIWPNQVLVRTLSSTHRKHNSQREWAEECALLAPHCFLLFSGLFWPHPLIPASYDVTPVKQSPAMNWPWSHIA